MKHHRQITWLIGVACCLAGAFTRAADLPASADTPAPPTVAAARTLLDAGQVAEARRMLSALDAINDDPEIDRLLGAACYRLGDWASARQHLRTAIRLDETAGDYWQLGRVYLAEDKYALAVEQFRQARQMGLIDCDLHVALAEAYMQLGQAFGELRIVTVPGGVTGALHDDLLLLDRLPSAEQSGRDSGDQFLAAMPESAIGQLARAVAGGCTGADVRLLEARVWLQGRRYQRAVDLFAEVEASAEAGTWKDAHRAAMYVDFAEALFGLDDLGGYLARLKQALRLDRADYGNVLAAGYRRVAQRYNQRGDLQNCVRYLELAVAEAPRDVELRYGLGNGYWEAGRLLAAAREWRIVLQIAPDHPDRVRMLIAIQSIRADYEEAQP